MTAPDTPSAILEHIRDGAESEITHPDDECGIEAGGFCIPHGALVLVAAVEAVLALADEARPAKRDRLDPVAWDLDPAKVREAITTALTGTPQLSEDEGRG